MPGLHKGGTQQRHLAHAPLCWEELWSGVSPLGSCHRDPQLPQILDWVKEFCKKTGASGQLCFDFMRDISDGRMYAFECNPRTSTILLNFYNHDHVAQAFFNAKVTLS